MCYVDPTDPANGVIKYQPWDKSHEPQYFERTDRSGRWNPIVEHDEDWPAWAQFAACLAFCLLMVYGVLR
jgi:hypothetical protein